MDNPNVVVVQSPLHEQQQQQLLQQQQQQQLLLQQELQHQQQQKLTAQAPKQNYQMNQPSLPLNLQTDYLVQNTTQPAAVSKPQTTAPTQYPAAPYAGYQNFNTVVPQPVTPAVPLTPAQPAAAAVYPSGITYYAPQSQTQTPRPLPSQRRPTSAIPILAPPERKSKNNRIGADSTTGANANINEGEESSVSAAGGSGTTSTATGAASDIDHILDNMFVQRPVFQPPIRKSPSPAPTATGGASAGGSAVSSMSGSVSDVTSEALKAAELDSLDKIGESVKKLTIQEEKLPLVDASGPEKLEIVPTVAAVDPTTG